MFPIAYNEQNDVGTQSRTSSVDGQFRNISPLGCVLGQGQSDLSVGSPRSGSKREFIQRKINGTYLGACASQETKDTETLRTGLGASPSRPHPVSIICLLLFSSICFVCDTFIHFV